MGAVGRLVDCSVIGLTFGMKLEELIMDTGRTTSIPVGHFRKEQAGGATLLQIQGDDVCAVVSGSAWCSVLVTILCALASF